MFILGINTGHDAGVALVQDGKVLKAINEERLSRKKMHWGTPFLSIEEILKITGVNPKEINYVAIANITNGGGVSKSFKETSFLKKMIGYISIFPFIRTHFVKNVYRAIFQFFRDEKKLKKFLIEKGIEAPVKFIDHHECHAATAYYTSQFESSDQENILVVTVDGAGDGLCSTVSIVENGRLVKKHESVFFHSPTVIYSYVTHNLGFKYLHHEGKITGLAAYGNPEKTMNIFRKIMDYDKKKLEFRNRLGRWRQMGAQKLHLLLQAYKQEDIAAGVQKRLEEVVSGLIEEAARRYKKKYACLAGGAFANVKLNQKILELSKIEDIFIHQNMGDGGVALGAALALWADKNDHPDPVCLKNVYLGSTFSNDDIEDSLKRSSMKYDFHEDIHRVIAEYLKKGKIIARFHGAMEYGPRALGHRSILYKTDDKTINDWLNKKLKRTEFMPFAPIVLSDQAKEYFKNFNPERAHAANFMTITYDVTDKCKEESPAITHIDNTARPQTVDKENNFDSWSILKEYEKLTKRGILINTSFNMHEEPIVCTPDDAIKAFLESKLDILAIENYIVYES